MSVDSAILALHNATDEDGQTINLRGYYKLNESSGSDLNDTGPAGLTIIGGYIGSPTFGEEGGIYGETNGGGAVKIVGGSSQAINVGNFSNFFGELSSKGIGLSFLFKFEVSDVTSPTDRIIFHGVTTGGEGIQVRVHDFGVGQQAIQVIVFGNGGAAQPTWYAFRNGGNHWKDGRWHRMTIEVKVANLAAATTADQCRIGMDGARFKATFHASATLVAVGSPPGLGFGATFTNGAVSAYQTGTCTVARVFGYNGRLTDAQRTAVWLEDCGYSVADESPISPTSDARLTKAFMGVGDPAVAFYGDDWTQMATTSGGSTMPSVWDPIGKITQRGDADITITQATSAKRPLRGLKGIDFGNKLMGSKANNPVLEITYGGLRKFYQTDTTRLAVIRVTATTISGNQCQIIGGRQFSVGTPTITSALSIGASTNRFDHVTAIRAGASYWSFPDTAGAKTPKSLPSASVIGALPGFKSTTGESNSGQTTGGDTLGSLFCDGTFQASEAVAWQQGSYSTALTGKGYLGGDDNSSGSGTYVYAFSGEVLAYVECNRAISKTEVENFWAAAKARWPGLVVESPEYTIVQFGDSISCHEDGTDYRSDGYQSFFPDSFAANGAWYNTSIRSYLARVEPASGSNGYITTVYNNAPNAADRILADRLYAGCSGLPTIILIYLGTNDATVTNPVGTGYASGAGNPRTAAEIAVDWKRLRDAAVTEATSAGATRTIVVGVKLETGTVNNGDAFSALIGTASAPADYVVTLGTFDDDGDIHPNRAGSIQIAERVASVFRQIDPAAFAADSGDGSRTRFRSRRR